MKIVLTGSLGNISKPLAKLLIDGGHQVTIISSNKDRSEAISALGATAAIGSVNDVSFLSKTFAGADVVYTMVPPNFGAADFRKYIGDTGKVYAEAIKQSGIKRVVNLSSIGAHLDKGTGPIAGLHDVEQVLNELTNVQVTHLRPGFFYVNFYANVDMIKHANIIGANYSADKIIELVHPEDISKAASAEIQQPSGKKIRYVVSDERTLGEVASVLGAAINKPELPWVEFTDAQSLDGMVQAGLPEEIAKNYVEMGTAIQSGKLWEDYLQQKSQPGGTIKLESFAKEFSKAF